MAVKDKEREQTPEEKEKLIAEKEKILVETRKLQAEIDRFERENLMDKQMHDLDIQRLEAEVKAAEYESKMKHIEMLKIERQEELEQAHDFYHRVYRFTSSVSETSVKECISRLVFWDRSEPECDISIIFASPGGSVIDGLILYDFIQELRQKGHKVTTSTFGWAASMAGILLQAGDKRIMHKEAWILIHEISFGAGGSMGAVEDTVEWLKRIQDRVLNIFAARCKEAKENGTATKALSKAQLEKGWRRKDWWISSDEALAFGLVDEIQ